VDFGDFQLLAEYFGSAGGWDEGNFTYGSTIDWSDFQLLATNVGDNVSDFTAGQIAAINGFAASFGDEFVANPNGAGFALLAVPEPASAGVMATAALGLLARRRARLCRSTRRNEGDHGNPKDR
jgi:hypothetical protein